MPVTMFDGLIVTDAMDMSGLTLYFGPEEGAVRAILAGNDVLLKPANSDAPLRGLREAVKTGRLTEERINQSVRKILAYKYKLGLSEKVITPIEGVDTVVSGKDTRKLTEEIAQHAMTLVKNEENLLPVAAGKRAVVLCLTNGEDKNSVGNTLAATLRQNGLRVERVAIDERATPEEVAEAIKKAQAAEIVIAGLYGRVRSGAKNSIGLPAAGEKVLREVLGSNAKVVAVSFGNPYLLRGFPEIKNYVVAYGDMTALQRAAGQAITGKIEFNGRLPITIGNYARGTGLKVQGGANTAGR
jgi:beta-N-acetylhexosaminidase